jgi:hypothetical protein
VRLAPSLRAPESSWEKGPERLRSISNARIFALVRPLAQLPRLRRLRHRGLPERSATYPALPGDLSAATDRNS